MALIDQGLDELHTRTPKGPDQTQSRLSLAQMMSAHEATNVFVGIARVEGQGVVRKRYSQ